MEATRTAGLALKHVQSNHFLTQTKNRAALDKLAMEVALIPDGNEGSWWKVLPAEKVRSMGDPVRDGDKITLQNVKFQDSLLYVSTSQPVCTLGDGDVQDGDWSRIPTLERLSTVRLTSTQREDIGGVLLHPSCNARYEVNAYPGSARFQVSVFKPGHGKFVSPQHAARSDGTDHHFVSGSSVCTLYLREHDCFLAFSSERNAVEWLPATAISLEATMWRLWRREVAGGGAALQRVEGSILLEHLASGRYLAVHPDDAVLERAPSATLSSPTSAMGEEGAVSALALQLVDDLHSANAFWSVRAFTEDEAEDEVGALEDGEVVWLEHSFAPAGVHGLAGTVKSGVGGPHLWLAHERRKEGGGAGCKAICRSEGKPSNSEVIEMRMVAAKVAKAVDHVARCDRILRGARDVWEDAPACPVEALAQDTQQAREAIDSHPLKNMPQAVLEVVDRCFTALILACSRSGASDPLKSDGPPVPQHQDRLRGVGVMSSVVDGLKLILEKVPPQHLAKEFPELCRVVRLGFRLLQKGCVANEANKRLLMTHLEWFNQQNAHDFGAFETSLEIYHDSVDLLMTVDFSAAWEVISAMLFAPGGKGRLLDIFANICVCRDVPIAKNQNVCVRFMEAYPSLTPTVEVREGDVLMMDETRAVAVSMCALMRLPGGEQTVLDPVASQGNADAEMYRFYLKVLDFLGRVLEGRNVLAARHFATHTARYALGYDHLLKVISSNSYPASYRARCCRLLDRLYIDCDPHLAVQHLNLTRVWSKLNHGFSKSREVEAAFSYIADGAGDQPAQANALRPKELKALLLQLTQEHARTNVEEIEVNRFVGSFVQLMHKLLLFGFYNYFDPGVQDLVADMEAVRTLTIPLLKVLDGRSDFCAPFGSFSADVARFEVTEKTVIVMDMKLEVIKVMRSMIEMAMSQRQRDFMECWDKVLDRKFGVQDWASAKEAMTRQEEPSAGKKKVCSLSNALHYHRGSDQDQQPSNRSPMNGGASNKVAPEPRKSSMPPLPGNTVEWTSEDVMEFAEVQRSQHPLMEDLAPARLGKISGTGELPEFFKLLLDLTRYKHKALKEVAIEFIFSAFSQHSTVMSMLQATHLVVDPETARMHFQIREDVLRLSRSIQFLPRQLAAGSVEFTMKSKKLDGGREDLLVDQQMQDERERKQEEEKQQRMEAFEVCFGILRKWTALCTRSHTQSARALEGCRRLLVNHGVDQLLMTILQIPVEREPAVERRLDRLADVQFRDLFGVVYELLGKLCRGDGRLQERLLKHLDLHLSLVRVEGVNVDEGLWAMMDGNATAMLVQGRQLIEFFLIEMLEKYDNPSPRWIDLVRLLSSSRENQTLVHKILSKQGAKTKQLVGDTDNNRSAVDNWDQAVAGLANPSSPHYETSMLRASMLDLLSTGCSGKQPSAEVFCASILTWPVALRAAVGPDIKANGEKVSVGADAKYKVRGAYLRFMHKVYMETSVKRLLEEQAKPDSGVWSYGDSKLKQCYKSCGTLMECVLEDLTLLVDKLSTPSRATAELPLAAAADGNNGPSLTPAATPAASSVGGLELRDELTWSLFQYVGGSVLPMLCDLYQGPEVVDAHPDAAATSEKIHDMVSKLQQIDFPQEWEKIDLMGETVTMRKRCWEALRTMSAEARVRQEWARHPKNQTFSPTEVGQAGDSTNETAQHALQQTRAAMLEQLARDLQVSLNPVLGGGSAVGLGLRQLALIMNKDSEVNMYDADTFEELGLVVPPAPQYEDFIISMLEICQDQSTKEEVLLHVLQLVRCSIYVVEPQIADESRCFERQWAAFLNQSAVTKLSEPSEETLQWLQEKYDGMGATTAALRLVSHPSLEVQMEAVFLLLVLLQGGNRAVQNTVAVYLTRRRDRRFFKAIKDVFDHAKIGLKDFKRMVKIVKNSQSQGDSSATMRAFMDRQRQSSVGFRAAAALLTSSLRLCQLLCEGQYMPFQRMMHKQSWLPSFDLLEGVLELFEITHPLVTDTLALNEGDMTALALQMIETISEAIQGPERVNQQVVLSSNFLAGCNRMLSSLAYTPLPEDQPPAHFERIPVQVSVSDLKSWLKSDVLKCTLGLFEACNSSRIPRLMQEFFELKKIVAQIVTIGRILGLADPVERQESVGIEDDADLNFGSIVAGSVGAFGSIKGFGSSGGGGPTSSRRGSSSFGSFGSSAQSTSFVRGGNASARQELVGSLKFSEGYEETLRGELFSLYFLLKHFNEFDDTGRVKEELLTLRTEHPVLYAHLDSHTYEVELVRKHAGSQDPQAEKVFFSVSSDMLEVVNSSHYQEQAQEQLFAVPRKNPTEKARALLAKLKKQMNRLMWVVTLARSSRWRRFVIRYREAFEEIPLFLSLFMTLLLMGLYAVPVDPHTGHVLGEGKFFGFEIETPGYETDKPYVFAADTSDPTGLGSTVNSVIFSTDPASKFNLQLKDRWASDKEWEFWPPARWLAVAACTLHLCVTAVNITAHLFHEFPLIVWDAWEQYAKELDSQSTMRNSGEKAADNTKLRPLRQGKAFLKSMRQAPTVKRRQVGIRFYCLLFLNSGVVVYFSFMALVSLLSWVMTPFFHVLYLLDFFRRKSGRLVTRSLVLGAPNLLRSFWLGIVVLVCFGFMSYNYFSDTINANQQMCRTPFQCVVKHLLDSMTGDLTTVLGNDLGVFAFPPMVVWADLWEQFRSLYVFVSLIFWVFLLQGIIQGQIIDAFAEMRNRADAMEEDLEQKCFVSSVDRFVFNSYPGEWEKRRGGKYVFNYLLFFAHLMQKDPEEMNGLDHAVHQQFEADSIDFMPIETFVARERERVGGHKDDEQHLVRTVAEDVKRIEQQLTTLKATMDSMLQRLPHPASMEHRASVFSLQSGPFAIPQPDAGPSQRGSISISGRADA